LLLFLSTAPKGMQIASEVQGTSIDSISKDSEIFLVSYCLLFLLK